MSIRSTLFLFAAAIAASGCSPEDEENSEMPKETAQEAVAEPAPPPSMGENVLDDGAPTEEAVPALEEQEETPIAAEAPRGKQARCKISTGGETYEGPCRFLPEQGGSFYVDMDDIAGIRDSVMTISVTIIEQGVAEVRGMTVDGINSRWGTAQRSEIDRACWTGPDFEVCAY